MKIINIIPTYYPSTYWGGPIFTTYSLNNSLARIPGVEVKVLTTDAAGPRISDRLSVDKKLTYFSYEVIFTHRIAGVSISTELIRRLLPLIRWADVVHLTAVFSFTTLPTLALCQVLHKPCVWSLRGAFLEDQNRHEYNPQTKTKRLLKAVWNYTCRKLSSSSSLAVHVTTEQEKRASMKELPGAHFVIIPNGVEVPERPPERNKYTLERRLQLMYLGRLTPTKGIENLLRAVAKLKLPVRLDIYGTATKGQGGNNYGERLVNLAKDLGILKKNVFFRGLVSGDAKTRAFQEADVCVVPSFSESFCVVVAEALAHGMPVIVSDRLAWTEVAKRGCGLVVGNDPDSLAKAIEKIRHMKIQEMGSIGWQWMRDEFGWDIVANKMYGVYRSVEDKTNKTRAWVSLPK